MDQVLVTEVHLNSCVCAEARELGSVGEGEWETRCVPKPKGFNFKILVVEACLSSLKNGNKIVECIHIVQSI